LREILESYDELADLNVKRYGNIFMGVNARSHVGGSTKQDVATCRCLWADMDDVTPEVARWRCQEVGIPDPSVLVDSGSGVHLYWMLNSTLAMVDDGERERFERRLKSLYRLLGCDATSDVNRLLRLPGFWNVKDVRSGAVPTRCELVQCFPGRRLAMDCFPDAAMAAPDRVVRLRCLAPIPDHRLKQILNRLDLPVEDRSRRDFGVMCDLLRLGVASENIWRYVAGRSKFATGGYSYFVTTLENAREVSPRSREGGIGSGE
jgi:hypothetical protein